jgi:hypothetical protein
MTKLESILKFVYAKGMENYIKYHRTEADGLKVVNQAIEQVKAMFPTAKEFEKEIFCIVGERTSKKIGEAIVRQIHKNMDEVVK